MKYLIFLWLISTHLSLTAREDSLVTALKTTGDDTNRVNLLLKLSDREYFFKPTVSLEYSTKALELARKLKFDRGIIASLALAGEAHRITGNFPASLKMQFEVLEMSEKMKDPFWKASSLGFIGIAFFDLREYGQAKGYLLDANRLFRNYKYNSRAIFTLINTGRTYGNLDKPDSALYYFRVASELNKVTRHPQLASNIPLSIGDVFSKTGQPDSALFYFRVALSRSMQSNESINLSRIQRRIAESFISLQNYDSAFHYAYLSYADAERTTQKIMILESAAVLNRLYRLTNKPDSALAYTDVVEAMKDSLYGREKFKQLQLLMLEEQKHEQQRQKEEEQYRNRVKFGWLYGTAGTLLLLSFLLFYMYRHKQKSKRQIEAAYSRLKSTQQQLIQSEKMASLGELTAGIAHEIQNPLNFVNNFSDVNRELIEELNEEIDRGNLREARIIAESLKENEAKINHHGKRADAIVKGMLQHSRNSSGIKELVDLNALCDEYIRLSYQGLRAKDKTFNAELDIQFDPSMGKIELLRQDIGRVLLNLLNNAFYSVAQKNKETGNDYSPMVSVSTKRHGKNIEIVIRDNGIGIPEAIRQKIFQPFFTTKPTGQGTGLGLSLSYDIVKAHGGEIILPDYGGQGAVFSVVLPVA